MKNKIKTPKFSVIIPTRNGKKFIERTIANVKKQTFTDYEIILIDDCSTDGSFEFIKEKFRKDKKIKVTQTERNSGPGGARNAGIKIARGEYIAFLDHDDEWLPSYLADRIRILENVNYPLLIYGHIIRVDDNSRKVKKEESKPYYPSDTIKSMLFRTFILTMSTVTVAKEAIKKAGPFKELWTGEDVEMYLRLARHAKFLCAEGFYVIKHEHSDNLCKKRDLVSNGGIEARAIFFSDPANKKYELLKENTMARFIMDHVEVSGGVFSIFKNLFSAMEYDAIYTLIILPQVAIRVFRRGIGRMGILSRGIFPKFYKLIQ